MLAAMSGLDNLTERTVSRQRPQVATRACSLMQVARRYLGVAVILQLAAQGSSLAGPLLVRPSITPVRCCCTLSGRGECHCRSGSAEGCPMCRRSAGTTIRCNCGACGGSPSAVLPAPFETIAIVPRVITLPFEQPRAGAPEQAPQIVSDFASAPLTPPPRA
jgi:hypothetical protein